MIVNRNNCQLVFLSWGCYTELPQTCWLHATESYFFTVLEARRQNQGVSGTMLPLKAVRENLPCLLQLPVAPGVPWLVATSLPSPPLSLQGLLLYARDFASFVSYKEAGPLI